MSICAIVAMIFALMPGCSAQRGLSVTLYDSDTLQGMQSMSMDALSRWLSEPWRVEKEGDLPAHTLSFDLVSKHGEIRKVDTCQQLFKADKMDARLSAPSKHAFYRAWAKTCYAARAITSANASDTSYVKNFKFDKATLSLLPPQLAFIVSNSNVDRVHQVKASGGGLLDVVDVKSITVRNSRDMSRATIKDESSGIQTLEIVAKGDFNRDGVEDLMVSSDNKIRGAHYHAFGLYIITQLKAGGQFKLLKKFPVM